MLAILGERSKREDLPNEFTRAQQTLPPPDLHKMKPAASLPSSPPKGDPAACRSSEPHPFPIIGKRGPDLMRVSAG